MLHRKKKKVCLWVSRCVHLFGHEQEYLRAAKMQFAVVGLPVFHPRTCKAERSAKTVEQVLLKMSQARVLSFIEKLVLHSYSMCCLNLVLILSILALLASPQETQMWFSKMSQGKKNPTHIYDLCIPLYPCLTLIKSPRRLSNGFRQAMRPPHGQPHTELLYKLMQELFCTILMVTFC